MPTPDLESVITDLVSGVRAALSSEALVRNLTLALVILLVGTWLSRVLRRATVAGLGRTDLEPTMRLFVGRLAYMMGLVITGVMALGVVGVPTGTLVAVVGAAALAIALALQDTLANAASGLLVIVLQPYRAGDYVEVGDDERGFVREVRFFHTQLTGRDNRIVLVPNKLVMENTITNYSAQGLIRIEIELRVAYDTDLRRACEVLRRVLEAEARVADDPPAEVSIKEFGDSGIHLALRPYVTVDDEMEVTFDLRARVKEACDEAGIVMPLPQRQVSYVGAPPAQP